MLRTPAYLLSCKDCVSWDLACTVSSLSLQAFWKGYFQLQSRQHGSLEVAVLALAKSGTFGVDLLHAPALCNC